MTIENLINLFFGETSKVSEESIKQLLSGDGHKAFLEADMSDPESRNIVLPSIGICLQTIDLPAKDLAKFSPETKKKMLSYLDNIEGKLTYLIADIREKLLATPKAPEEMSREELLDYIKQKFNK